MINKNIKKLRNTLKMNQNDFGGTIGIKGNTLSVIETGGTITEQIIITICAVHRVNRTWLETGEGDIFNPDNKSVIDLDPGLNRVAEIYVSLDKSYKDLIIEFCENMRKHSVVMARGAQKQVVNK